MKTLFYFFILFSLVLSNSIISSLIKILVIDDNLYLKDNDDKIYKITNPTDFNLKEGTYTLSYELIEDHAKILEAKEINTDLEASSVSLCDTNNGDCDSNAVCTDLGNSRVRCVCKDGFIGNGKECHKIESSAASCDNKNNGYYCYPYDCCDKFYPCVDGRIEQIYTIASPNKCKNGYAVEPSEYYILYF